MKRLIQAGCLLCMAGILLFYSRTIEYTQAASCAVEVTVEAAGTASNKLKSTHEEANQEAANTLAEMIVEADGETTVGADYQAATDSDEEAEAEREAEIEESEYADFAISNVTGYVNIRDYPSTDGKKLGKLYHGAVAQILETAGENGEWFHILSGSVEGYIKSEYFLYGSAAAEVIEDYVTHYAVSQVRRLNVRREPSTTAKKLGYLELNEKAVILENQGDWLKIDYNEGETGYVAAEYVQTEEQFTYAVSLEEEREQQRRERELALRKQKEKQAQEAAAAEGVNEVPEQAPQIVEAYVPVSTGDGSDIGSQVVEMAKQYLGNKYVHGGSTLSGGTDCSGFTSLLYKEFGYSLSRTPGGQLSGDGTSVSVEDIKVGDIVCYGKKGGKCTHVGIYAGNNQIIHSSTPKTGVKYSDLNYDHILGVKRIAE